MAEKNIVTVPPWVRLEIWYETDGGRRRSTTEVMTGQAGKDLKRRLRETGHVVRMFEVTPEGRATHPIPHLSAEQLDLFGHVPTTDTLGSAR